MKSLEQSLLEAANAFEKVAEEMDGNVEEKKDEKKDEEKKDEKKDEEKKEKKEEKDDEKVQEIKSELGISEDLAEKVASSDPSIVKYIKALHQEIPVDSMGDTDTREKTASDDIDPFEEFLSTPL